MQWKRLGRCEALWESSKLGDMPLDEGGVAMPHSEEGLHRGSFPPQEELSSQVEFCKRKKKTKRLTRQNISKSLKIIEGSRCTGRGNGREAIISLHLADDIRSVNKTLNSS